MTKKKKVGAINRNRPRAKRRRKVLKSAASGKFVSKKFAKKHPRTTYAEKVAATDLSRLRSSHGE